MSLRFLQLIFVAVISTTVFSQVTNVSLVATKDAYTSTVSITSNFGTDIALYAGLYANKVPVGQPTTYHVRRSEIECDISSIPSNAIITSAVLRIYATAAKVNSPVFKLSRNTQSWTETGITWSNHPSFDLSEAVTFNGTSSAGMIGVDVKAHVQKMVAGVYSNYGWTLSVDGEGTGSGRSQDFASRENSTSAYHPKLEISYYVPMSISNAIINHQSSTGANDGSISPTLANGPGGTLTYQWYNSAGAMAGKTALNLTGVPYGWYGLRVTSNTVGSVPFFYAFLVGKKCSEVTIDFNPGPDFIDDAMLNSSLANTNYGSSMTTNMTESGSTIDQKSLMRFRLWLDDHLELNQATLKLRAQALSSPVSSPNAGVLNPLSTEWNESNVSFSKTLNFSATPKIIVPAATTIQQYSFNALPNFNEWKVNKSSNFGWILQFNSYNNISKTHSFYSSDFGTTAYRPMVSFRVEIDENAGVTHTWDTITNTGELVVNTSDLCGEFPPFKYVVSENPIPELDDMYQLLVDSLSDDILDSTSFFGGSALTNMSYENLQANKYYIAVFNRNWDRVVDETIQLQAPLIFKSSVGLSISGNEITANSSTARGILKAYTHQDVNSEIFFNVNQLVGEQFAGYIAADASQPTSYTQLLYGFRYSDNKASCMLNGTTVVSNFTITTADELSLKIENGVVYYKNGNTILSSKSLNSTFEMVATVVLQNASKIRIRKGGFVAIKLPSFYFSITEFKHLTCNNDPAYFKFKLSPGLMMLGAPNTMNYTVKDKNNVTVASGSSVLNTIITINQYSNGDPLIPGVYTVSGTFGSGTSYSGTFRLGYEADWNEHDGYILSPNTYSLSIQPAVSTDYAHAFSRNMLSWNDEGWIQFNLKSPNSFLENICRPSVSNIMDPPFSNFISVLPNIMDENFLFTINTGTLTNPYTMLYVFSSANGSVTSWTNPLTTQLPLVRLEFDNVVTVNAPYGSMKVFVNNILLTTIAKTQSNILARFNSLKENSAVQNVVCSFGCKSSNNMFAELKYELDGYYHIMKNGKIKIAFNEEYAGSNLKFNIYNVHDELVKTQDDFPNIPVSNGPNYIELDVSNSTECIGKGYFYIETISSKKEKMYLRFYNDFSSTYCPNY